MAIIHNKHFKTKKETEPQISFELEPTLGDNENEIARPFFYCTAFGISAGGISKAVELAARVFGSNMDLPSAKIGLGVVGVTGLASVVGSYLNLKNDIPPGFRMGSIDQQAEKSPIERAPSYSSTKSQPTGRRRRYSH